jgi:hypothetical protein
MYRIKRFDEKIFIPETRPTDTHFVIKIIDHRDPKDIKDGGQVGRDYIYPKLFKYEKDADFFAQKLDRGELGDEFKGKDIQIVPIVDSTTSSTTSSAVSSTTTPTPDTSSDKPESTVKEPVKEPVEKKIPMDLYIKLKNQQQSKKLRQQNPQAFQKQMSITSDLYSEYKTSKEKSDYLLSEIAKELKMGVSEMTDSKEVEMRINSSKSQKLKILITELKKLYPKQLSSNYRPAPVIDSYTYTNRIMKFNEGIIAMAGTIAVVLAGIAALRGVARNPVNQTGPSVEWFKIGKKSVPHPLKSAEQDKITYKKPYVEDPKTQLGSFFGTKV